MELASRHLWLLQERTRACFFWLVETIPVERSRQSIFTHQTKYWIIILVAYMWLNFHFSAVPPWFAITNMLNNLKLENFRIFPHVQRTQRTLCWILTPLILAYLSQLFLNRIDFPSPAGCLSRLQDHLPHMLQRELHLSPASQFQVSILKKTRCERRGEHTAPIFEKT